MIPVVATALDKQIESLELNSYSGQKNGLIWIRGLLSSVHLKRILDGAMAMEFVPQRDGDVISRFENKIDSESAMNSPSELEALVSDIRVSLNDQRPLVRERYTFRYDIGHSVPKHRDRSRHKLVSILYLGDFDGGEYVYLNGVKEHVIDLRSGDVLISINELPNGKRFAPVHRVAEIRSGVRFCQVISCVSKDEV